MVVILIGCGTATQASDPTALPFPSSTEIAISQTATRLPTATRRATATLRPSATPSISPTVDLTEIVLTQNSLATQALAETLAIHFPRVCEYSYGSPEFSPNQLWMAESCFSEKDQDNILTISNKDSQVLWELVYQAYITPIEFPGGVLKIVHWAKDGRYVYFLSDTGGSGFECFYRGRERGAGLFRLDLQSGWTTTILSPNNDFWWYGLSFSPTDRRLVYGVQAQDMKILDLTSGKTIDIITADDNYETGGYFWSPDGLQFVYSVLTYVELGERMNYSLRLVDAETGNERILIESPENCFVAKAWKDGNILEYEVYGKTDEPTLTEYDLNSNTIRESTATP